MGIAWTGNPEYIAKAAPAGAAFFFVLSSTSYSTIDICKLKMTVM